MKLLLISGENEFSDKPYRYYMRMRRSLTSRIIRITL